MLCSIACRVIYSSLERVVVSGSLVPIGTLLLDHLIALHGSALRPWRAFRWLFYDGWRLLSWSSWSG